VGEGRISTHNRNIPDVPAKGVSRPVTSATRNDQGIKETLPPYFSVMVKPVGPVCNLNCAYCYYIHKDELYPEGENFRMSPELLERYVRDYIAAQPGPQINFAWQGGEPTLMGRSFFRQFLHFVDKYLPPGWQAGHTLQTNGTMLDDEWCRLLKERHFLVGISIDGPAWMHDYYRRDKGGRPTHEKVIAGLRLLQKYEIDYNILCVVNNLNAQHPLEVYNYFKELGATWIQFIPIVERVGERGVTDRSVPAPAFGRFLAAIFDEWIRRDVGKMFIQIFEECVAAWMGLPASLCIFTETCGRGLIIEHNGDVYACDHFVVPECKLGNMMETPLKELANGPQQVRFGLDKRDKLPRYCRDCPYLFICHGACPKDRFIRTPDGEEGLSYLCEGYKIFFSHADPYLRQLAGLLRQRRPAGAIMDLVKKADQEKWKNVKRNDPCPCGSGLKYKHCCLTKPH